MTGQEATVIDIRKEADALASLPTHDRLRVLKRILPQARVEDVFARAGRDRSASPRLPACFVVALGLFSHDGERAGVEWSFALDQVPISQLVR